MTEDFISEEDIPGTTQAAPKILDASYEAFEHWLLLWLSAPDSEFNLKTLLALSRNDYLWCMQNIIAMLLPEELARWGRPWFVGCYWHFWQQHTGGRLGAL